MTQLDLQQRLEQAKEELAHQISVNRILCENANRREREFDALQPQVNALAAEGSEFFAYSSEHGYETYNTAAEACKAAEDMIPDFLVDGWDEEVNTVSWGRVVGSAVMANKRPAPNGSEFDFICDYVIQDFK